MVFLWGGEKSAWVIAPVLILLVKAKTLSPRCAERLSRQGAVAVACRWGWRSGLLRAYWWRLSASQHSLLRPAREEVLVLRYTLGLCCFCSGRLSVFLGAVHFFTQRDLFPSPLASKFSQNQAGGVIFPDLYLLR